MSSVPRNHDTKAYRWLGGNASRISQHCMEINGKFQLLAVVPPLSGNYPPTNPLKGWLCGPRVGSDAMEQRHDGSCPDLNPCHTTHSNSFNQLTTISTLCCVECMMAFIQGRIFKYCEIMSKLSTLDSVLR